MSSLSLFMGGAISGKTAGSKLLSGRALSFLEQDHHPDLKRFRVEFYYRADSFHSLQSMDRHYGTK
jgi:hypothetical protein